MNQKLNNTFPISNLWFWGSFLLLTVVYIKGLFNIIYGIDASIYASISKEMIETGNWLQIFHKGHDYLDKPPLHFWLVASSYKIFGVSSFSYKLPSFLFTLIGVFSTYKLGSLLYNKNTGKLASLIYYSCFAIIIINQDVRTDTILVAIVVFSIWQLVKFIQTNSNYAFIYGFMGIGMAMLSKGPIGLMVPVLALGTHFLIKKEWKHIFKWKWLLGILISFLVISPMLYGLYQQFDAQPDKVMNLSSGLEVKGISGLKFYFWDQSFGRITGDNMEWKNESTPFFFTHTFAWSFIPWTLFGIFSLFWGVKRNFSNIPRGEFITIGAIVLPFIAFSLSSYKLPHYIYVFFPFWFILTSNWLINVNSKNWMKLSEISQIFMSFLFVLISFLVISYVFPSKSVFIWCITILLTLLVFYIIVQCRNKQRIILSSIFGLILSSFIFNFHFIPALSEYDAPYQAAVFSRQYEVKKVYSISAHSLAFDIYSNATVSFDGVYELHNQTNQGIYLFLTQEHIKGFEKKFTVLNKYEFKHKGLTSLTLPFLNPKTRESQLEKFYLIEI